VSPGITAIGQRGAAGLFGGLAGAFKARPLHPAGIAFEGTFTVEEPALADAALFAESGEFTTHVRFSRGFGLPEPLPEILSVAIKVRDAYGPGADQDFLLTASGERPVLRHTFAWGRSHLAHPYSSVLPFSVGGETVLFGATPLTPTADAGGRDLEELAGRARRGDLALRLRVATLQGPWRDLATIRLSRRLDAAEEQALTYNSDTTGGGIAAVGFVNRLRGAAYDASARVRPT
jgi:hypothetical protein